MPEHIIEDTVLKQILAKMIHDKQEKNFQNESKLFYYYLLLDLSRKNKENERAWMSSYDNHFILQRKKQ